MGWLTWRSKLPHLAWLGMAWKFHDSVRHNKLLFLEKNCKNKCVCFVCHTLGQHNQNFGFQIEKNSYTNDHQIDQKSIIFECFLIILMIICISILINFSQQKLVIISRGYDIQKKHIYSHNFFSKKKDKLLCVIPS